MTSDLLYFISLDFFMLVGVVVVGYFQFKSINRSNQFKKAVIQCFFGLIIFLVFYLLIDWLVLHGTWPSLSTIILLIGAIVGLNFLFLKAKKQSDLSN